MIQIKESTATMKLSIFERTAVFFSALRVEMTIAGDFVVTGELPNVCVTVRQNYLVFKFLFFCFCYLLLIF